jgi:hypothetical protein
MDDLRVITKPATRSGQPFGPPMLVVTAGKGLAFMTVGKSAGRHGQGRLTQASGRMQRMSSQQHPKS